MDSKPQSSMFDNMPGRPEGWKAGQTRYEPYYPEEDKAVVLKRLEDYKDQLDRSLQLMRRTLRKEDQEVMDWILEASKASDYEGAYPMEKLLMSALIEMRKESEDLRRRVEEALRKGPQ